MKHKSIRVAALAVFAFALVFGVASLMTTTEAGRCLCPKLYGPVRCDNGKVYMNPCLADCHNAKNCVPTGDL